MSRAFLPTELFGNDGHARVHADHPRVDDLVVLHIDGVDAVGPQTRTCWPDEYVNFMKSIGSNGEGVARRHDEFVGRIAEALNQARRPRPATINSRA